MKRFPEDVRAVLDGLWREFDRVGRGTMARTARALGIRRSFFSEKRSRPPHIFDIGVLLAVLRTLAVDPAAFFGEIGGGGRGELWEGFEPIDERATPATRRAVAIAYRRMGAELGIDLGAGGLDGGDVEEDACPAVGSVELSNSLGAKWLENLDARRLTEPAAVIRELAEHLHQVEAALLPRALGIWGSALWVLIDLEAAAFLNRRSLRLAAAAGDDAAVVDLLLRRGHVMADAGDHRRALELADQAAGIADRIGDQEGRGRAAGNQAKWLYYLRRPRESSAAAERALELLPESLPTRRFAAYAGRCLCCLDLGEPRQAQDLAEAAERLPVGPWDRGKLSWIRASISRKLGKRSEALEHLRRAAETFRNLHHGEALLISLGLVQALLEDDQPAEALQICRGLFDLVEPVRANPIISGALTELLRVTLSDKGIPLGLVRQVRAKIERERARARRAWRALAVVQA